MAKKCAIDSCVNELKPNAVMDTCQNCRHGFYYWRKKRPAEVLERRRKLTMYRARLIYIAKE